MRDQALAVYGRGPKGAGMAVAMLTWSKDVIVVSDGPALLDRERRYELTRHGIQIREERIARLAGREGVLESIVFSDGGILPRRAMFFNTGLKQRCGLVRKLGCNLTSSGTVRTNRREGTNIPGLYVAGDASRDVQFAIVAAAEGATAAVDINRALQIENYKP